MKQRKQFCRLSPTIGCAPSRIHARALSSPNSRENAQNRWAHLEPFNLGFALKIVQRCPIYTLQNPPLCAFPDNPWNIEYSILQKNPLMSQCSFVPADPWSPLFGNSRGLSFSLLCVRVKTRQHYLWRNPFGVNRAHPSSVFCDILETHILTPAQFDIPISSRKKTG